MVKPWTLRQGMVDLCGSKSGAFPTLFESRLLSQLASAF